MRVALDTNVLISGTARSEGLPGLLVIGFLEGKFDLVTSEFQIDEFKRVSRYPRVKKFLKPARAGLLVNALRESALIVSVFDRFEGSADEDDNVIISVALAGKAKILVSGDVQHVIPVGKVGRLKIVTVEEAVSLLHL